MPKPGFKTSAENIVATQKQCNFLQILFNDLGYNRTQRNGYLTIRFGRSINFLDDLTLKEAGSVIGSLVEERDALERGGFEE